jgi:hypothetical protein
MLSHPIKRARTTMVASSRMVAQPIAKERGSLGTLLTGPRGSPRLLAPRELGSPVDSKFRVRSSGDYVRDS